MSKETDALRDTLPPDHGELYPCSLCGGSQRIGALKHHALVCAWALRERLAIVTAASARARVAARRHREQC